MGKISTHRRFESFGDERGNRMHADPRAAGLSNFTRLFRESARFVYNFAELAHRKYSSRISSARAYKNTTVRDVTVKRGFCLCMYNLPFFPWTNRRKKYFDATFVHQPK